jgi:Holliday junction resolvasome RuvABC endonuclease subunit
VVFLGARVLGLDLALGACGWAVVDSTRDLRLVASGVISLPGRRTREDRAAWNVRRYRAMRQALAQLLVRHPGLSHVAYEYPDRPFRTGWRTHRAGRGVQRTSAGSEFNTAQGLGLAEGFLIGTLAELAGLEVDLHAITIGQAKQLVTGNANASKDRVRATLLDRFGWRFAPDAPDQSDAAAIAAACVLTPRPLPRTRKTA